MINLKKWMAKVSDKLNITTADYVVTTGTEKYQDLYYVNLKLQKPKPSMFYVYFSKDIKPAFVQRVEDDYLRVYSTAPSVTATIRCVYIPNLVGGNILFTPLNRIAQILLWRKEAGVC